MKKKIRIFIILITILATMTLALAGCGESDKQPNPDASVSGVSLGDQMIYGNYQGEDIKWRVIDLNEEEGSVLLLSEYALDQVPYNERTDKGITWEVCTLRQWLNQEFMNTAFTEEEQKNILPSTSEGFPKYNSRVPGKEYDRLERETEDQIFLLSYTEVQEYLGYEESEELLCYPTEYVKSLPTVRVGNNGACEWWLCAGNHGDYEIYRPCVVSGYAKLDIEKNLDSDKITVRPAMWLKL